MINNYFTVDTEDWFQVFYGQSLVARESWTTCESHIERFIDATLLLLSEHQVRATFFVVGWIGEKFPHLVRKIRSFNHEIASHSYWHSQVFTYDPAEFAEDLVRSKKVLEDAIGEQVLGYRAPGYSLGSDNLVAIEAIERAGYLYDSSILSGAHFPYNLRTNLIEVPPNALIVGSRKLPIGGGFFFRALPLLFYEQYLRYLRAKRYPLNFYTHTWEIEWDYPRLHLPYVKRFIQYYNLRSVQPKLNKLFKTLNFVPIADMLRAQQGAI